MNYIEEKYQVVVVGGGLAGLCAAVASARQGAKTVLLHDRPVLGGVASSEMRVTVHGGGAHHAYGREGGIISEILAAERAGNHETTNEGGWTNSVFDMACYNIANREPNLTLYLNTTVADVMLDGGPWALALEAKRQPTHTQRGYYFRPAAGDGKRITAVKAQVGNAELMRVVAGDIFIDCTGDGVLAHLGGCEWRMGSEGKNEFQELHAPAVASTDTMGNSIHIRAKDMGRPCPYTPPDWAVKHSDPDYFYKQGRPPTDVRGGYWWIEIGMPWHTIHDNETIRHELTRHALGVWDWMKNHDPVMKGRCKNFALDFIGQVPGKRESRRIAGLTFLNENDIVANTAHPDEIAHGGWFIDLHTPGGLLAKTSEPHAAEGYAQHTDYAVKSYVGPYGIPLGVCIARDLDNLFMAGRCVSVSRAALGTVRVMGTTALMGQACGTAAAVAVREKSTPARVRTTHMGEIQQTLLRGDVFLPHIERRDEKDLAPRAAVKASSEALSRGMGPQDHYVSGGQGILPAPEALLTGWALDNLRGQLIAVGNGDLTTVKLCLSNTTAKPLSVPLRLQRVSRHSDYAIDEKAVVASGTASVSPGLAQWVSWEVNLKDLTSGYLRLEVEATEGAHWLATPGLLPGQSAQVRNGQSKSMKSIHGAHAFQVEPPQSVYGAAQVLTGATRPHLTPNLWRSEPGLPFPQSLELAWQNPVTTSRVEITFAGHLFGEVHREPPFFVDPQMVKDFYLEAWDGKAWNQIAKIKGNIQRVCRIQLEKPVHTAKLRAVFEATHGDPSAAVYGVRVY